MGGGGGPIRQPSAVTYIGFTPVGGTPFHPFKIPLIHVYLLILMLKRISCDPVGVVALVQTPLDRSNVVARPASYYTTHCVSCEVLLCHTCPKNHPVNR